MASENKINEELFCEGNLKERLYKSMLLIETIAANNQLLPKHIKTEREEKLHNAIITIFKVAHVSRIPDCMSAHPEWEEDLKGLVDTFGIDEAEVPNDK